MGSDPGSGKPYSGSFPDPARGRARGKLLVVSGPSGVGKSSVVHALAARIPFHFSVSWTTRERRPGEQEGIDYVFVDRDTFLEAIDAGGFLEWAEYSGYYYGTPRRAVLEHLARGDNVLLDIENDGAKQVKASYPDAVLVFIMPPSLAELERRLQSRGDTSPQDMARRLAIAEEQMSEAAERFDFLVVNEDVAAVVDQIVPILSVTGGPEPASP